MSANPVSFRVAFGPQIDKMPPEHQVVIKTIWNAITDLQGANQVSTTNIKALQKTTGTSSSTSGAGTTNVTENITQITNNTLAFTISDQTGNTAYTVQQSDNSAIILLNDASPVAVTLDSTLTIPYGCIPVNQGAGLVTLTPSSGTINGAASITLPDGYFAILGLDGTNWFAAILPTVPITFTPVPHEFLTGYDQTSGVFSAAQPAFTDLSGQIDPATQMPASGVAAGSYTLASMTVDAEGLVTAAANGPAGISVTITTAALTGGGTQGSQTFVDGVLTAQVQAT